MHKGSKNVEGAGVGCSDGFPVGRCVGFGVGLRGAVVAEATTTTPAELGTSAGSMSGSINGSSLGSQNLQALAQLSAM